MPADIFRRASAPALFLAGIASAQIAYKEAGNISVAQRALPGSGPGAAHANPAHLAETRLAHLLLADFDAATGKADQKFFQAAATVPPLPMGPHIAFSAGFEATWNNSKIDNSNAVFRVARYSPGVALSWPVGNDRPWFLALGLALPLYQLNSFGAAKNLSTGADLGFLGVSNPGGGRLAIGLAYRSMVSPAADLPDNRGSYDLPGWVELAFDWTSPERRFQVHYEQFFEEQVDESEGPARAPFTGINGWSFEFRPFPMYGLKLERPRLGSLTSLGIAIHPEFSWGASLVELNISHDRIGAPSPEWLFGEDENQGRGALYAFTLATGL